jgi:CRP-like cAMP-binding protein
MALSGTIVGQFDPFKALDNDARAEIASMMRVKYVRKGTYIITSGNDDTDVYFLVSGHVRVCFFAENGKQVHFEELEQGMMFGELAAIDHGLRSSDCLSVVDCQLATLSEDCFRSLILQYPAVLDAVLTRLAAMVRANMRKVYEFSAYTVAQRVRFELLRLASQSPATDGAIHLVNTPTHAEFAARIGTHREGVTRELNALIAKGIITWTHSHRIIHDVVALSDK